MPVVGLNVICVEGTKDEMGWKLGGCFDPVDLENGGLKETDDKYIIDNRYHVYEFNKSDVEKIEEYELCQSCERDISTSDYREFYTGDCPSCIELAEQEGNN